jgi:hypothetical protein
VLLIVVAGVCLATTPTYIISAARLGALRADALKHLAA